MPRENPRKCLGCGNSVQADKSTELSVLKVHNATEKSKLGTDCGLGAAQTNLHAGCHHPGAIPQTPALCEGSWMLLNCR